MEQSTSADYQCLQLTALFYITCDVIVEEGVISWSKKFVRIVEEYFFLFERIRLFQVLSYIISNTIPNYFEDDQIFHYEYSSETTRKLWIFKSHYS